MSTEPYCIVGVESTGLGSSDGVVELTALKLDENHGPVEVWRTLLNPERPITSRSQGIHGYSAADLSEAPLFEDVIGSLFEFLDGTRLLAHNALFVKRMIQQDLARVGEAADIEIGCIMTAASQAGIPKSKSEMAKALGIPREHLDNCGVTAVGSALKYLLNEHGAEFDAPVFVKPADVESHEQVEPLPLSFDDVVEAVPNLQVLEPEEHAPVHELNPTDEQIKVLELCATGLGLSVQARAGAGKTTTLRMAVRHLRGRGMYLAFNKDIATEAGDRFPKSVSCRTIHSLAYGPVGSQYAHRMGSDGYRRMWSNQIAEALGCQEFFSSQLSMDSEAVAALTVEAVEAFCRSEDSEIAAKHVPIAPSLRGLEGPAVQDMAAHVADYAKVYWKDICDPDGRFPFEHNYYLKMYQLSKPQLGRDWIMLDEAQDANPAMLAILRQQKDTQLILVGDDAQQIYSWNGSINSLETLRQPNKASLTTSWRFGPEIAAEANKVLVSLGIEEGVIGGGPPGRVGKIDEPDAILCRTNAGLVAYVFDEIRNGRKVAVVGGTEEVQRFARGAARLKSGKRSGHLDLARFATWHQATEWSKAEADKDPDLARLIKLVDKLGAENIRRLLEQTVSEQAADVVVSTTHKAKGREWGSVKLGRDFKPNSTLPEELRLLYVAITRAQHELDMDDLEL